MRCSHNSSSVLLYSKIYERFSGANLNIFYLFKKMTYRCLFNCSPQNSMWLSAVAKGFAEVDSVFIVITSTKMLPRWLFPSKIYIQFTIFNTYFSTKLLFTNKRYHLQVLEKCLYGYKKSDQLYIFGSLFILFLFVHVAMEQALLSRLISSYQCSITCLNNFYFVSFFYHLFIYQR